MKTYQACVIGCKRMGKMHIENIKKYCRNVHVKSIVDNNIDLSWASQQEISEFYLATEFEKALSDKAIDAVIIAAPSSAHVELIEKAAAAQKHIFCEKPVVFTIDDIKRVKKAVKEANVILQVGLHRRFDPHFLRVKEKVTSGAIGNPHIMRITNRDANHQDSPYFDFNIHDFDMARFIIQQEVVAVFAMGAALIDQDIPSLNDIDTATITLTMSQGTLCVIDSSRAATYGYDQRLSVFGSKGEISADNVSHSYTVHNSFHGAQREKSYDMSERYHEAYRKELQAFFEVLETGATLEATLDDMQKAIAIAQAANESLRTKNKIVLLPI